MVGRSRLSTVGDRAFPVATARIWNSLPPARHYCTFVAYFPVTPQDSSLRHFLSQSLTMYSARAVTLSFWTCINRPCYLYTADAATRRRDSVVELRRVGGVIQFTISCAVELLRLVRSDDIMTSLLKKLSIDQNSRS